MPNMDMEQLKKNASAQNTSFTTTRVDSKSGIAMDPLQAALERDRKEKEAAEAAALEAYNDLKKSDGREYEYEVAGFNIGDSIMRRARTLDANAQALSDQIDEERMNEAIGESEEAVPEVKEEFDLSSTSDDIDDILAEVDEDVEEATPVMAAQETVKEPIKEAVKAKPATIVEFNTSDMATQEDLNIDDEDLLDLGDLDVVSTEETSSEDLDEKEMEGLKAQIKEKLSAAPKNATGGIKIVNKAVSLSSVLAKCAKEANTIDWPLMSAGRNVTMKQFTATEIENLNRGSSGRNRFNTLKEIYRSIYDHIVSEKPEDFEEWLRTTSFLDIEHLYMAIYKASFNGANYIPYQCVNETCKHVFLSDNIDMMDMVKFKDDAAKKRFYDIYENSDKASQLETKLYQTTVVPITDNLAIGFREPSIYNTIFENSVLDQTFISKYERMLAMMVYIDNIYYVDEEGNATPIAYKVDKQSVAKTAKYRIATYAKLIQTLPSDGYQKVMMILSEINDLGDGVTYITPEHTCDKCKQSVPEETKRAAELLFSRHQLNLLSQQ